MSAKKIIGHNLRARRKELKLTQTTAAQKLNIKRTTYGAWETGGSKPTLDILPKIVEVFLIDDLYLFISKLC